MAQWAQWVTSRRKFPHHHLETGLICLIDSIQLKPREHSTWSRLFKSKRGKLTDFNDFCIRLWKTSTRPAGVVSLVVRPRGSWRAARHLQLHLLKDEEEKKSKTTKNPPTSVTSSPREGTLELKSSVSETGDNCACHQRERHLRSRLRVRMIRDRSEQDYWFGSLLRSGGCLWRSWCCCWR